MKKKQKNLLLGIAATLIWGTVVYRIFDLRQDTDEITVPPQSNVPKRKYNDYAIARDTSTLMLNYPDPFNPKPISAVDTVRKVIRAISVAPVTNAVINWDFVKYSGFIENPSTRRTITILTINGRTVMLSEGETIDNVTLIKNLGESVKIRFKNKIQVIFRSNATS